MLISYDTHSYGQVWKQYADSAKTYQEQKKINKAIEFYSKAREALKKDSIGTEIYATFCNTLANHYRNENQFKNAEILYIEAKRIREKVLGKGHRDYARSCNNLASLYVNLGRYEKAGVLYSEAMQIQGKVLGMEDPDYIYSCSNLATLYSYMGQYKKAEPLYLTVKMIKGKLFSKEHLDYASSCSNLATLYLYMWRYDEAESLILEAKQIQERQLGKEHPDYAASCKLLADIYYSRGRYDKAELLHLEAKQIIEKILGKENLSYAYSCNDLASVYVIMGAYNKAEPLYLDAKQILEKTLSIEHPDYAASCNNLANLYYNMGQDEKAEPLFLEAKSIRERVLGKQHPDYEHSCYNIALLYREIGQYGKAQSLLLEAKHILERTSGKGNPEYAKVCNDLAFLYQAKRQYTKAKSLFLEAKEIQEKKLSKKHPDYAASCSNLALLYQVIGQYKNAEPLYLEAKGIQEKILGKEHPDYAISCSNLANFYQHMVQYNKAEPLFLEAKQIREKALGKDHPDYAAACNNLANLYWVMHNTLRAEKEFRESFSVNFYNLSSIFQITSEKEKAAYIKNILGEDDKAYSFYVSEKIQSGQPYSLSLFHRNLILSSVQALKKQVFSANDTTLGNTYNEWIKVKKHLSILYARPITESKEDIIKTEEKASQLEKELIRLSSVFAKQQQQVNWKNIQTNLKANEASIEFTSFHFTDGKRLTDTIIYVAFVLRKDSLFPTTVALFKEKQLQNLLSSARYKTNKEGVQRLYTLDSLIVNNKTVKKSIYELVWKPLEKELTGIKTIYFAPSGLLHKIAFAALPTNQKEVLSDRYKLIQLATTAAVADQQPYYVTDSDKIQVYGGISYNVDTTALKDVALAYHTEKTISRSLPDDLTRNGQWNELPGTNKEIKGIVSLSGKYQPNITSHSGTNATEENIKSLDGIASPAVLHIATHGFFFPDPKEYKKVRENYESGKVFKLSDDPLMRSGLLFAGANHAWQNKPVEGIDDGILTAYEVSNLYLPNTKLAVLSGCETGLGDVKGSEGVYGLQRAFKIAGVNNLVMSLWKVSDQETVEFMEEFYKNMFAQQTISDAFYNAQNVMKNKYRLQPYKWAAWILLR